MSPLSALHATNRKCRESILRDGLLGNRPHPARPYGVYVYRDDDSIDHPALNPTVWCGGHLTEVWKVSYIGPAMVDEYVLNGLILLEPPIRAELTAEVTQ